MQRVLHARAGELHRAPVSGGEGRSSLPGPVPVGGGRPLPAATREFFEPRFGYDFGHVRVHDDSRAAESSAALNARAYTHGHDIVFGKGQYAPDTQRGRTLLAHELTHVVQQDGEGESIQRACGPTDIGTPVGCTPATDEPIGDLARFRVNCDDFVTPGDRAVVEDFADSMTASDRVRVHGFASIDGNATFNHHVSCARALRAASVIQSRGVGAGQIDILEHGGTPGPAAQRRSVVLERMPGVSRPVTPQLLATVITAPTGGICGDNTYRIRWSLTRNSDAVNGGFVVQDITFNWNVTDCAGSAVATPPFVSPLRYFEAWRVPPGTTQPNATAVTVDTDRFFWPGNAPWGGTCSDGRVTITATARYHDGVAAAALPAHMTPFNGATFANDLPASLANPALGGSASRPVPHSMREHWACCPCASNATVVDSHVP